MSKSLRQELATYALGYILAVLLTGLSFAIVFFQLFARHTAFVIILVLALIQVIVHMRSFLHITFKKSAREDLHLILFATVIIIAMAAGTFIVIYNLDMRVMM